MDQNQPDLIGTFLPYSKADSFPQVQPCVATPSVLHSGREDVQPPVETNEHAVQYFNTEDRYQPISWNGEYDFAPAHAAYNHSPNKTQQNYACWNEPFSKGNFVQFVPSVNTYTVLSVMPTTPDISSFVSIRNGKHNMDEIEPLLKSKDENRSQVCPFCGLTFVYQANFTKHLTAAGCCQPPCKKSRNELDIDTSETFKNNTLPRASRSKKVTRSNSTKSRKRPTIPPFNSRQAGFIPNSEISTGFLDASLTSARPTNTDLEILQVTPHRSNYGTISSEITSQTPYHASSNAMFCSFCNLQLSTLNLYQRHRLAHALVIQLTRCLELSLPPFSPTNNEKASGSSNSSVLNNWLTDQVRVNFNDQNWLRISVKEVEQVLGNSNMDVDIRQRHGIRDDADFQNVVDLLIHQDLNLSPRNECSEASRISYFFPEKTTVSDSVESSGSCDLAQHHSSPINPLPTIPDILPMTSANGPVYHAYDVGAGCGASNFPDPNFLDLNQSEESFNSLVTDLDTVEKRMATLLNAYDISPEYDQNFTQPDLTFQNVFNE